MTVYCGVEQAIFTFTIRLVVYACVAYFGKLLNRNPGLDGITTQ
jgi:hypothetical protein